MILASGTILTEEIRMEGGKERHYGAGEGYLFVLIQSGRCHYKSGEKGGTCGTEDILCVKPGTRLVIRPAKGVKKAVNVVLIRACQELLSGLSDEETDLEAGFAGLADAVVCAHANSSTAMLIRNLIRRLLELKDKGREAGTSIYKNGILAILFVMLYRTLLEGENPDLRKRRKGFELDDLFSYIKENLTEELTLEDLERHFYVSKFHIAREFKRQTGDTVHHYIVKARLDLCREYIAQGMPVSLVYRAGGFGGYNHFFRAFKQEYGMTPKAYYKLLQEEKAVT